MDTNVITYEQPFSDQMRLNLRIEQLFKQLNHHLQRDEQQSDQLALETLISLLDLTERPDLKNKLSQSLSQQMNSLVQLEALPAVDQDKLQNLLHRLDCMVDVLNHGGRSKIADSLRQDPFLKSIRQHPTQVQHPGSAQLSSPAYLLWLHQSPELRRQDMQKWLEELRILEEAVSHILQLLRHRAVSHLVNANNTFYQQSLDSNLTCHMVRITVPVSYGIYPRVSISRNRLSIRFEALQTERALEPGQKLEDEFPFELHCCYA